MLSNLLMQNKLRFATCVALVAVMAACGVTAAIYTFVIPRDVLNELMITIPVATIVSFPIAWYIGSISIQLKQVNSDLLEAKVAAESAERVKSEFLANMSHEIRTPMNGVMGMVELLAKTNLDQRQRTFTDIILKSGTALVTIINDILDYSKIDAGQLVLDPAPFRLDQAVEEIVTLYSTRILEKDLEIMVRVDPALPRIVIGDVGRLRQIIGNLVSNAIKFTETGHVLLEVTGDVKGEDAEANLTFRVQDTGIGIPSDEISSIFDKFSQIDMSATRKHEGTGLGLAISASLVKLMGGKMGVESEIGVGSTFWFSATFPLAEDAPPKLAPADVSGARILVIDENSVSRAIIMEQINAWQFDAACATSGEEALALITAAAVHGIQVDLIIFDYHIRDVSGAQILAALKADPNTANIPLLIMTSVDQMADRCTNSSLGITAQLSKPIRASTLLDSIVSLLEEGRRDETSKAITAVKNLVGQAVRPPAPAPAPRGPSAMEGTDRLDVLVCEDNEVNRIVFTQILDMSGYSYEIAKNGRQGWKLARERKPRLILMDVSMPEMNGLEATFAIRNDEEGTGQHTPIIGVTAHALKGDEGKCLEAGMDDYLPKPVSPEKLIAKIEKHLVKPTTQRISA